MARVSTRSFLFFRLSPVRVNSSIAFAIEQGKTGKSFGVLSAKFETFERPLLTSKAKFPIRDLSQLVSEDLLNGIFKKKDFYGEGTLLVNVWDLYRDEVILQKTLERIKTTSEENNRFEAKEGDVFFCRSSLKPEGVGWSCLLERLNEPAVFECHLIRARVNSKEILPSFLNYFARSYFGVSYIRAKSVVTTMATIDQGTLYNLPVICPPVEKQIELVAAMDEARSHRKQKLAESDALLDGSDTEILNILGLNVPTLSPRNIFATRLSDLNQSRRIDVSYHLPFHQTITRVLNSCPYPLSTISELCCKPVGGATPKKGDQELYTDSGIKFLRILNIKANEIDLTDVKYIKPDVHEGQLKRSQLDSGDVLMTITGRVGTAAVVNENILPANINQHIVRLKMLNDSCLPEYLAAYLNTNLGLTISNRSVTGGTRMALDYGAIQAIPIPLPPKKIQEQVIAVVQHRRSEAQRLRSEAETGWQIAKQWFEDQLLGGS
ncbi:restriction endonuclease subunit S [Microcystis protocystis FBCC-A270]|uniref:restriction endonuclease subunit S n=1 Tax=Microcystis protocystis TaxID=629747 RepID=UPI003D282AD1